jgi:PadR family transcriptional regulator PadR
MPNLAQLLKGNTDVLILSLLSIEPMYGYQMIKELERRSDGFLHLSEGTLYPALHRLERAGQISSRWQRTPSGQERRYYSMTRSGEKQLKEQSSAWAQFSSAINLIVSPA